MVMAPSPRYTMAMMVPAMMMRIGIGRRGGDAHEADGEHRRGKKSFHDFSLDKVGIYGTINETIRLEVPGPSRTDVRPLFLNAA